MTATRIKEDHDIADFKVGRTPLGLSRREFRVLSILNNAAPKALRAEEIGERISASIMNVKTIICRLRNRIADAGGDRDIIVYERNNGYRITKGKSR